jgi:chromosome segregation ATPase
MTLSGPEALRSLDEALRDIRREEDEIAKRLARSAELISKIRESENELFRQLAQVRLDAGTREELGTRLTQAESRARDMLARHAEELAAAEAALAAEDKRIAGLVAERSRVIDTADRLQDQLKAIADRIEAEATGAPEYQAQRAEAERLGHIAEEAMRKTEQAEADRDEKGRPYRDDPLFMYLWENGYGTRNYRANPLVTWLDGLIARHVGFVPARPNYAMLNEIPMRLREHAERQQQVALQAREKLSQLAAAAIDAAGGKPVRDELEAAQDRVARIDAEMVELEDRRDDLAQQQRDLAQGSDPTFAAALSALAETLQRNDMQTLLAEARLTRTPQDDTIVKQIDDARSRAAEEEAEAREQKARLKTLAGRRRELEDIQFEFKKANFDNPRSTFREDRLVGDLLTDFLRGGITAAGYWDQWRRSQNWSGGASSSRSRDDDEDRNRTAKSGFDWPDVSFGGGTRRSSGSNWGRLPGTGSSGGFGGGFSRPRTGGSPGNRGGGFKTGGGF